VIANNRAVNFNELLEHRIFTRSRSSAALPLLLSSRLAAREEKKERERERERERAARASGDRDQTRALTGFGYRARARFI